MVKRYYTKIIKQITDSLNNRKYEVVYTHNII